MNDIVIGGWAVGTDVLSPIFGSTAHYIDINRIMPELIHNGVLIDNWQTVLKKLITPDEYRPGILAGWSTGAIAALALAPILKPSKLILLSATPSFCRRVDFRFGIKSVVLKNMINSMKQDIRPVINQFLMECGMKNDSLMDCKYTLNELVCGLQFLEQATLLPVTAIQCRTLCLHGKNDKIIPSDAGKYLCEKLGGEWFEFEGQHVFFNEEINESKIKELIITERE